MSTRCQIAVEDNDGIKIYKHSDGYPEGVLDVLIPTVANFATHRGWDPTYLTARILMAFALDEEKSYQEYATHELEIMRSLADKPRVLGFGLDTEWHGDIEFAYVITKTFDIEVHCFWGKDKREPSTHSLIWVGNVAATTVGDALQGCKDALERL